MHMDDVIRVFSPEVKSITGSNANQLYILERKGLFPTRVRFSERCSGWYRREVVLVLAARAAGLNDHDIRDLVTRLHEQRVTRFTELEHTAMRTMTATVNTSGAVAA